MNKRVISAIMIIVFCVSQLLPKALYTFDQVQAESVTSEAVVIKDSAIWPNLAPGLPGGDFYVSTVKTTGIMPVNSDDGIGPKSTTQINNFNFFGGFCYTQLDFTEVDLANVHEIFVRMHIEYSPASEVKLCFFNPATATTMEFPTFVAVDITVGKWVDVYLPVASFKNTSGKMDSLIFSIGDATTAEGNIQFDSITFVPVVPFDLPEVDSDGNTFVRDGSFGPNPSPSGMLNGDSFAATVKTTGIMPDNTDDGIGPKSIKQVLNYKFPPAYYYTQLDFSEIDLSEVIEISVRLYIDYSPATAVTTIDLWFYNTEVPREMWPPLFEAKNTPVGKWVDVSLPAEKFINSAGKINSLTFSMGGLPTVWGNVQFDSITFDKKTSAEVDEDGNILVRNRALRPNPSPSGMPDGSFPSIVMTSMMPINSDDGIGPKSTIQVTNYTFPDSYYYTQLDMNEVDLTGIKDITIRLHIDYSLDPTVTNTNLWFYNTTTATGMLDVTFEAVDIPVGKWVDVVLPASKFRNEWGKINSLHFAIGGKPTAWGNVQFDSITFVTEDIIIKDSAIWPNPTPGLTGGDFRISTVKTTGIAPANSDDGIGPKSTKQVKNFNFVGGFCYTQLDFTEVDLNDINDIVVRLHIEYSPVSKVKLWFFNPVTATTMEFPAFEAVDIPVGKWVDISLPLNKFKNTLGKMDSLYFSIGDATTAEGNIQFDSITFAPVVDFPEIDSGGNILVRDSALRGNRSLSGLLDGDAFTCTVKKTGIMPANSDDGVGPKSTKQVLNYNFPPAYYYTQLDFDEIDLSGVIGMSLRFYIDYSPATAVEAFDIWFYNTATPTAMWPPLFAAKNVPVGKWVDVSLPVDSFKNTSGKIDSLYFSMGGLPTAWGNVQFDSITFEKSSNTELTEYQLTNMSPANVNVRIGEAFREIKQWQVDSVHFEGTGFASSGYPDANEDDGLGATGEVFVRTFGNGWAYGACMLEFDKKVKAAEAGKLVFRMFIDSTVDDAEIWFSPYASSLPENTAFMYSVNDLGRNKWIDVEINARNFADDDGYINYITVIVQQRSIFNNPDVGNGKIYIDNVDYTVIERNISEEFTTVDISDIVPMERNGLTLVAETDDKKNLKNIAFARLDYYTPTNAIKMKATISDISEDEDIGAVFNMYTTIMAKDLYFENGGLFFWLSDNDATIGTRHKNGKTVSHANGIIPAGTIKDGVPFDLEYRAIPFFVNQAFAGYYVAIVINDNIICDGFADLLDIGDLGDVVGTYFEQTIPGTKLNIKPINQSNTLTLGNATEVVLNARYSALNIHESTRMTVDVFGIYVPQTISDMVIVEGADVGHFEEGYLVGDKDGIIKIQVTLTNPFGTYNSNILEVIVGDYVQPDNDYDSDDNSDDPTTPGTGDKSMAFVITLFAIALASLVIYRKKSKILDN